MNLGYTFYRALTAGVLATSFVPLWLTTRMLPHCRLGLGERMGFLPPIPTGSQDGRPRVWIHSASLGEVRAAESIIAWLLKFAPECRITVSTMTAHGRKLARASFHREIPVVYAPLDTVFTVRKALSKIRPKVMVFLETEIWPIWLSEAHRCGVKTALINGRISVRSVQGYKKLRPFFRAVLKNIDAFSMISNEDARRIIDMGADPERIEVNGNAKVDSLAGHGDPAIETEMRQTLNLEPSQPVFVAGSTREGEEEIVLEAYENVVKRFPETVLVIAPRHVRRTPAIVSLLKARGLRHQLRTEIGGSKARRTAPVVVMNTWGELFRLYSVGTIIFCGASLVPLGGQNPLEAAAWGKVVFYGPSMEDFIDAKNLLESVDAGIEVSTAEALAQEAIWLLDHPETGANLGGRARELVKRSQGAAEKHARVIAGLLAMF